MTSSSSPVRYQTYDMPLAAGARPGSVVSPLMPRPGALAPAERRLLERLPASTRALFVGGNAGSLARAYQQRQAGSAAQPGGWEPDALATLAADADLVVITEPLGTSDNTVLCLETLAAATPAAAMLVVSQARPTEAIDVLCALLMDAGWMPDSMDSDEDATSGQTLQATKCFGAEALVPSGEQARFSVVVVSPDEPQDPAAGMSPGLAEVDACVTVVGSADSAAGALAAALPSVSTDWVLVCHEDAYFPAGFGRRLNALLAEVPPQDRATALIGFIGIGVAAGRQGYAPAGFVVEQLQRQDHGPSASAVSIDELALVVARDSLHRIDPAMGWHLWATDLCLTAITEHEVFARIAPLPLLHRSAPAADTKAAFEASALRLADKFPGLVPIPTLNGTVDATAPAEHRPAVASATPVTSDATPAAPASAAAGQCSVCEQRVAAWTPHPQRAARSEFMRLLDVVGSDLSVYQCPACGCNDRDRHLWHYLRATGLLQQLPAARILHIAPERHLELLIQAQRPQTYVRGDLLPKRPDHLKLDVEALPFDADSFDVVICNHVLEHVASPQRALAEFHRCLSPGGVLVAQTPYAPALKHTLELNRPVSPGFAKLFYGQEDHVRLFGADITALFHGAGFKGELLAHEALLADVDAKAQGCNAREPFFLFAK